MCSIFLVISVGRSSDRKLAPRACATNHSRLFSAYASFVAYHDAARNAGTAYLPIRCCASEHTVGRHDADVPGQSTTARMCAHVNRDRLTSASTPAWWPSTTGA